MITINIGSRREVLWDDYLVQEATAVLTQNKPVYKGVVLKADAPWEGRSSFFPVVVFDSGLYHMYYRGLDTIFVPGTEHGAKQFARGYACCAESRDGIHWNKPSLGIFDYNGSTDNNIIYSGLAKGTWNDIWIDSLFVFKDINPACALDAKYKALFGHWAARKLLYLKSADGLHFEEVCPISEDGAYDSMNTAFWDNNTGQYFCYIRGLHDEKGRNVVMGAEPREGEVLWTADGVHIRDIRVMTSKDFDHWTPSKEISYTPGTAEYHMYTNNIQPYYRADHMFLGLPTRFFDRGEWSSSFEALPDPESRKERQKIYGKCATALTDCVLMTSRDGYLFNRWDDEAFLTAGPERPNSWVYGDAYPGYGMAETKSDRSGAPNELSMYLPVNYWAAPVEIERHTIRVDGFFSYNAPIKGGYLLTKPIIYEGNSLSINFATSALGEIAVSLIDGNGEKHQATPVFGDSLDRRLDFKGFDIGSLSGKMVKLLFELRDARLYSFKFS